MDEMVMIVVGDYTKISTSPCIYCIYRVHQIDIYSYVLVITNSTLYLCGILIAWNIFHFLTMILRK